MTHDDYFLTQSDYFRFRTSSSGLPDDELMLLDRIFDGIWYPPFALYRGDFALHANLFSHNLSSDQIHSLLTKWLSWGWLEYKHEEEWDYYSLTPVGGEVWERERLPIWPLYCEDWGGSGSLTVFSPSFATAKAFLRGAARYYLWGMLAHSRKVRAYHSAEIGWKTFPQAVEIVVRTRERSGVYTNRNPYEQNLRWWRDVSELVELRLNGVAPWPESNKQQ